MLFIITALRNGMWRRTKCNNISILFLITHRKSIKLNDHHNPSHILFFLLLFPLAFPHYFHRVSLRHFNRNHLFHIIYFFFCFDQNIKLCVKQNEKFVIIFLRHHQYVVEIELSSNNKRKMRKTNTNNASCVRFITHINGYYFYIHLCLYILLYMWKTVIKILEILVILQQYYNNCKKKKNVSLGECWEDCTWVVYIYILKNNTKM